MCKSDQICTSLSLSHTHTAERRCQIAQICTFVLARAQRLIHFAIKAFCALRNNNRIHLWFRKVQNALIAKWMSRSALTVLVKHSHSTSKASKLSTCRESSAGEHASRGAKFTCFTGTKAQKLTSRESSARYTRPEVTHQPPLLAKRSCVSICTFVLVTQGK